MLWERRTVLPYLDASGTTSAAMRMQQQTRFIATPQRHAGGLAQHLLMKAKMYPLR
jgi:hypothetical protein